MGVFIHIKIFWYCKMYNEYNKKKISFKYEYCDVWNKWSKKDNSWRKYRTHIMQFALVCKRFLCTTKPVPVVISLKYGAINLLGSVFVDCQKMTCSLDTYISKIFLNNLSFSQIVFTFNTGICEDVHSLFWNSIHIRPMIRW